MKNRIKTILILSAVFVYVWAITHVLTDFETKKKTENLGKFSTSIKVLMETAYAEGQKDALKGNIKIKSINFGRYVWTKSPWVDGSKTITDTLKVNEDGHFR
jgi:hypothetical protein